MGGGKFVKSLYNTYQKEVGIALEELPNSQTAVTAFLKLDQIQRKDKQMWLAHTIKDR